MTHLSQTDQQTVKVMLGKIVDSKTRISAENEHINELVNEIKEQFDITPKIIRKTATILYKQNLAEEIEVNEEIESLYEVAK